MNSIMSNPIKDIFDKESMIKDISERDNAIKKIQELRISDEDIAAATSINLAISSIPFSQSTNDQIVGELIMQRDILRTKLIKKQLEE